MMVFAIVLNMVMKTATIKNNNGIHVRPSQAISGRMSGFTGELSIRSRHAEITDTNTISIISLGLVKGDEITITVTGRDEEAVGNQLVSLFEYEYDFPPREAQA